MHWLGRLAPRGVALCLAMSIAGCASAPPDASGPSFLSRDAQGPAKETPDPFEDMNRKIFESNQEFNNAIVYPIARAYRENLPEGVRNSIDAFTTNLSEPMVFANTLLQLRLDAAATTLARFLTNSTVGVAGLFDVAATVGQTHQTGDIGQTLYVWGVRDTAYLVLPVLGPTNVRDGIGTGIGMLAPLGVASIVSAKLATATSQVNTVDAVSKPVAGLGKVGMLEELEASSVDFYAMLRSVSDQQRQAQLKEALDQSLLAGPAAATPVPTEGALPKPAEWQAEIVLEGRASLGGPTAAPARQR